MHVVHLGLLFVCNGSGLTLAKIDCMAWASSILLIFGVVVVVVAVVVAVVPIFLGNFTDTFLSYALHPACPGTCFFDAATLEVKPQCQFRSN